MCYANIIHLHFYEGGSSSFWQIYCRKNILSKYISEKIYITFLKFNINPLYQVLLEQRERESKLRNETLLMARTVLEI